MHKVNYEDLFNDEGSILDEKVDGVVMTLWSNGILDEYAFRCIGQAQVFQEDRRAADPRFNDCRFPGWFHQDPINTCMLRTLQQPLQQSPGVWRKVLSREEALLDPRVRRPVPDDNGVSFWIIEADDWLTENTFAFYGQIITIGDLSTGDDYRNELGYNEPLFKLDPDSGELVFIGLPDDWVPPEERSTEEE